MRKNDKEASKPGPRELQLGRSFYPIDDSLLSLPILRQHGKPQKTSTLIRKGALSLSITKGCPIHKGFDSLQKEPFLLALRCWGRGERLLSQVRVLTIWIHLLEGYVHGMPDSSCVTLSGGAPPANTITGSIRARESAWSHCEILDYLTTDCWW